MTAQSSRYLFDNEFAGRNAAPGPEAEPCVPEPALLYSEEDLDAARRETYESGFAAGERAAQETIAKQIALAVGSVGESIRRLVETHDRCYGAAIEDVVVIALGVARKFIGEQLPERARDIVVASAHTCLERLHGHSQVTVTVPEPLAEAVKEQFSEFQNLSGLTIDVRGSAMLSGADCEISWDGGFAVRSDQALWEELSALAGLAAERETVAHPPPSQAAPEMLPESEPLPDPAEAPSPAVRETVEPELTPAVVETPSDTQQTSDNLSDALGPELRAALEQARQVASD